MWEEYDGEASVPRPKMARPGQPSLKRTPLGKRTNNNSNTATRNQLDSSMKKNFGSSSVAKTPKRVTFGTLSPQFDEENQRGVAQLAAGPGSATTQAPLSSSSLRQYLRSTIHSSRVATPSSTPRSLLRSEIMMSNGTTATARRSPSESSTKHNSSSLIDEPSSEKDDSFLLCSPLSKPKTEGASTSISNSTTGRTIKNTSSTNNTSTQQPRRRQLGPPQRKPTTNPQTTADMSASKTPAPLQPSANPTTTESRAGNTTMSTCDTTKTIVMTDLTTLQQRQALADIYQKEPYHPTASRPRSTQLVFHNQNTNSTPFTPRVGGVCLDLSEMFRHAQSSQKKTDQLRRTSMDKSATGRAGHLPPRSSAHPPLHSLKETSSSMEQQLCDTFTNWLNYTLQENNEDQTTHGAHHALILYQQMGQVRIKALQLFNDAPMERIRTQILDEIGRGKIKLRSDRDLHADLTQRNKMIDLLFNISLPWLRLALETMFGQSIVPEEPQQLASPVQKVRHQRETENRIRLKTAVKSFIVNNLLSDKQTLDKYTGGKCNVPSGSFEVKYRAEMKSIVLYRLLVLFYFLDRAKQQNILEKVTRLFGRNSPVKSTRELLLSFSRDFLSAEGDFVKHLSRIGLRVSYRQEICDELDYSVTNLAIDLRDGVRLARLYELITGASHKSTLQQLRLPAVSRLQKLHNIGLVLDLFRGQGVNIDIIPHHIVDGHREFVLKLMWLILSHCCLTKLVSAQAIERETIRIKQGKHKEYNMLADSDCPTNSTKEDEYELIRSKLLGWCQAVAGKFAISVENLESSLEDGRVLCLLIHYYHPELVRWKELKARGESLLSLANRKLKTLGGIPNMIPAHDDTKRVEEKSMILCLAYMFSRLIDSSTEVRAALLIQSAFRDYQRSKLRVVYEKMAGKILRAWREHKDNYYWNRRRKYAYPVAVIEDFVFLYQPRLRAMARRRERKERYSKACTIIQSHVRRKIAMNRYRRQSGRDEAALLIQSHIRGYVARVYLQRRKILDTATRKIQRAFRKFLVDKYRLETASILIQKVWRGFYSQMLFHLDLIDIVCIQSRVRGLLVRTELSRRIQAASLVQKHFRSFRTRQKNRSTINQIVRLQSVVRRYQAQKRLRDSIFKICLIQRLWRTYHCTTLYHRSLTHVTTCQAVVRRWIAQNGLERRKHSIGVLNRFARFCLLQISLSRISRLRDIRCYNAASSIQQQWRLYIMRKEFDEHIRSGATIIIQSGLRMFIEQMRYIRRREAAIRVQSALRRRINVRTFRKEIAAVVKIQSFLRARRYQWAYDRSKTAVGVIQSFFRQVSAQRKVQSIRFLAASIIIQSSARRMLAKLQYSSLVKRQVLKKRANGALFIQKIWRGYIARTFSAERMEERRVEKAACSIQKTWRCYTVHVDYLLIVLGTIEIQSAVRSFLGKLELIKRKRAVDTIQRFALHVNEKRRHVRLLEAACLIQSVQRSRVVREWFLIRKLAATIIQRSIRGYLVRYDIAVANFAATEIQKMWRGLSTWADFVFKVFAIVKIQSFSRMIQAKRRLLLLKREAIISEFYRDYCGRRIIRCMKRHNARQKMTRAAIKVQRTIRRHLSKGHFGRFRSGILQFQAQVRGAAKRKSRPRALGDILQRLEAAALRARAHPEHKLGYRTTNALSVLQNSRSLSEIMSALRTLELATRLSYVCCEAFVSAQAPTILFSFATTCNRSVPHTEVIQCTLTTMLNVTQYRCFLPDVANESSLEICLDLVQMFRDKEGVFVPAVILLEQIVRFSDDLQQHCGKQEHLKRLKGVYTLCRRKLSLPSSRPSISGRPSIASYGRSSLTKDWKRRVLIQREAPDLRQGVRTLQRIVRLVDPDL